MRVTFATGRPAHVVLPANLLAARGADVTIYTAAYRSRFRGLAADVKICWVPQGVPILHFITGLQLPRPFQRVDTVLFDRMVGWRVTECDIFWGWASGALLGGRAARRRGARFVLDRACPHVDVQQRLIAEESERLGVTYRAEPRWFHDRQLAEYEEADTILVPSEYSKRSFSSELQAKVLVAPLYGRVPDIQRAGADLEPKTRSRTFTFGNVSGQPLRKGLLYLLKAWEQLQLPNARLLIRTDARLARFPALRDRLARMPNVELVGYVDDMSSFYRRCDAFVFPTLDDGFGMALVEAMAHGLPAISTDHCGAAELFTPKEDLLIVPAQNSDALAEAMQQMYSSDSLCVKLRARAFQSLTRIEGDGAYGQYSQALDKLINTNGS